MRNPNHITNPKTIRRYEREKEKWAKIDDFLKEKGYSTKQISFCGPESTFVIVRDGVEIPGGYDSHESAKLGAYELINQLNTHQ